MEATEKIPAEKTPTEKRSTEKLAQATDKLTQAVERLRIPVFEQLRWRLTAIFLIVAIVPIALITSVVLSQVDLQSRTQVFNQLDSISILKLQQVETWIQDGREMLQVVQDSPESAEVLGTSEVIDTPVFSELTNARTSIDSIFFYDLDGQVVAASDISLVGRVVGRQPYFEASLDGEHLEPPYFDVSTGELALIATTPIYEGETMIGIAALRYNTEALTRIMLERTGLGETGETYLVSLENNYLLTASRFEGFDQNRAYNSVGIERALAGENGQQVYDSYRTAPVFGVYRWIPELASGLITEITETEALNTLNQARNVIIVLAVIISAVVAAVGLFTTEQLARPIVQITKSASALAQGDFNQRVAITRKDEIGVLGDGFNNMAQAVQDRTEQLRLARDEARASQRIAQENSRLKSEFLSTMSHELRTPMNAIEGFTGIILKRMAGTEYNDKTERYMLKVQSNSKRLLSLINDFLDLSRIESGRLELAHMPMSPAEMAQKWYDNLSSLAENKGLEFESYVDPELPPTLYGDEESISKIAINLVGNAIKFTETGRVSFALHKREDQMELSVRDTGIGIPAHARDFIFDEFRQVDQSSKREHGGTGLGLAIVQKLARAMGGTVTVQSQVGVGSTFIVMLPIQVEKQEQVA